MNANCYLLIAASCLHVAGDAAADGEDASGDGSADGGEKNHADRHDDGGGELAGCVSVGREHEVGDGFHGAHDFRRLRALLGAGLHPVLDFLLSGGVEELVDGGAVMQHVALDDQLRGPGGGSEKGRSGSEDGSDAPPDAAIGGRRGAAAVEGNGGESAGEYEEEAG